ncbi:MAG TPA: phosphoglycolate phosphatase [Rhodospirillaceae bacterium]|nr:phosphoglycolate phosphatase [Rhodospirillaceae bacterium]HAT35551.1 phosphoglycolate phosphatase [Rhodospirillaceae bacterium]|tara:strand:- start:193 stop:864 length:672 start_codon:yes stop_codon:yes gene_type:complete
MTLRFPYLVFDFDGTIVESAVGMTACMNQLMTELDRPSLDVEQVELMIGQGIQVTVDRAMKATGGMPADLEPYVTRFKELYYSQPIEETPLYPGVTETLTSLRDEGYVMGLCTNKVHAATLRLCEGLDIARFFKAIAGGDTYPVRKPDPGHLEGVIEEIGGDKDQTVMIGDSINDIGCANAANVRSIAVTYGYTKTPPEDLGADRLIDRFDQVPDALGALANT